MNCQAGWCLNVNKRNGRKYFIWQKGNGEKDARFIMISWYIKSGWVTSNPGFTAEQGNGKVVIFPSKKLCSQEGNV